MDLFELEMCKSFLKIEVINVDKKDLKKYINSIEDEYKNEIEGTNPTILYTAYTDDYKTVTIQYDEEKSQAFINYEF